MRLRSALRFGASWDFRARVDELPDGRLANFVSVRALKILLPRLVEKDLLIPLSRPTEGRSRSSRTREGCGVTSEKCGDIRRPAERGCAIIGRRRRSFATPRCSAEMGSHAHNSELIAQAWVVMTSETRVGLALHMPAWLKFFLSAAD